jgi:crotonobetainyl-CoA:carnitine CoA-transferase CaiB-like acyl-CoA transferase
MIEQEIPQMGSVTLAGTPFRLSEGQVTHPRKSPVLGEYNEYVYSRLLGLSQEEINDLINAKVIY